MIKGTRFFSRRLLPLLLAAVMLLGMLPALTLLEISGWAAQNGARSFVRTVALPEE